VRRRLLALVFGGVVLLGAGAAAVASLGYFDPVAPPPDIRPAPISAADWKETRRYSVLRVLIVEGRTTDRERAVEIATLIARPSSEAYDEVLVYVKTPGDHTRRVQWTKAGGFKVLDY
jgi:hypothetical protein